MAEQIGSCVGPGAEGQEKESGKGSEYFSLDSSFPSCFPSRDSFLLTDLYNKILGSNGKGNRTCIYLCGD